MMGDIDYDLELYLNSLKGDERDILSNEKVKISKLNKIDDIEKASKKILSNTSLIESILNINNKIQETVLSSKELESRLRDIEVKLRVERSSKMDIINKFINILDMIDWILQNISDNNIDSSTLIITRKKIELCLADIKLFSVARRGDLFNKNYEICVDTAKDQTLQENQIVKVIKNGYLYGDKVIRLAEVIVVKND